MATQPQSSSLCVAFGPFEVDTATGELRKSGVAIRLSGQLFQILNLLLAHSGTVVTREQLREQIWGNGTFVDFEHGLNVAMNKLRRALGDSAEDPRYIETVPGRGYRFIGLLEPQRDLAESPKHEPAGPKLVSIGTIPQPRRWLKAGTVLALIVAVVAVIWASLRFGSTSREIRVQQLTTNSAENPIWHAVISPDGKYVAYGDMAGIHIRLISTGESHLLPKPVSLKAGDAWFPAAWLPDSTSILASSITAKAVTAWRVSVIGGTAFVLRENTLVQSIAPGGSSIAFLSLGNARAAENLINARLMRNSEIWTMDVTGGNARRVLAGDRLTYFGSVRWSPDGKWIAYQRFHLLSGVMVDYTIEVSDLTGRVSSIILAKRNYAAPSIDHSFPEDFCWLKDGRLIYALREAAPNSRDSNLWQVALDSKSGKPRAGPRRITNLAAFHLEGLSVTADGTKLTFESSTDQSYVLVGQLEPDGKLAQLRRLTPDERYNTPYAWTPEGKAVIFRSDRTGSFAIYKQALDQDVPEMIPTGPGNPYYVRVTPDGGWLVYPNLLDVQTGIAITRIPLGGGQPQVILPRTTFERFDCPRRPGAPCMIAESNGNEDVFSSFDPASGTRHEEFRVARKTLNWRLSVDGSRVAMVSDNPEGGIEVRSRTGQLETRLEVKEWPHPFTVEWSADDKAVLVSHPGLMESPSGPIGTTLLRVDFEGHAQAIWETRGARYTWGIPSPDGKYLAIRGATTGRNAWMIENF